MSRCIRSFYGKEPKIASSSYVDESAAVIGDVILGDNASVWPQVSVRGDLLTISIGKDTNIQDCSTLHTTEYPKDFGEGFPLTIGNKVTVGHGVILHGCEIKDNCLIGMGSTILDGVVVEPWVFLGAGSLVPPGKVLESGYMYLGSPVKKIRPINDQEKEIIKENAEHYVKVKDRYKADI